MNCSVVIPIYNRKEMLDRTLKNLLAQSYKDFEVIIVDDGSSDNLMDVIIKYPSLNVQTQKVLHCGNIARLRNIGCKLAVGKYIAILDSDDYCTDNRLLEQIIFLDRHNDVDILASFVNVKGSLDKKVNDLNKLYNKIRTNDEIIQTFLNDACCICNSSVMMRKEVYKELGGYNEDFSICEDFEFWMRAFAEHKSIFVLDKKLTTRTVHANSVTTFYWGNPIAIKNVIKIKLQYLFKIKLLTHKKHFALIGKNSRDKLVIEVLDELDVNHKMYEIIDIYNEVLNFEKYDYYLITEFENRNYFYDFFISNEKEIVKDFIYL